MALSPGGTPRALTSTEQLEIDLLATEFRGFALLDEETALGVRSLAAPVRSPGGVARLAIELQGPTARIDDVSLNALAGELRAAALALAGLPLSAIA